MLLKPGSADCARMIGDVHKDHHYFWRPEGVIYALVDHGRDTGTLELVSDWTQELRRRAEYAMEANANFSDTGIIKTWTPMGFGPRFDSTSNASILTAAITNSPVRDQGTQFWIGVFNELDAFAGCHSIRETAGNFSHVGIGQGSSSGTLSFSAGTSTGSTAWSINTGGSYLSAGDFVIALQTWQTGTQDVEVYFAKNFGEVSTNAVARGQGGATLGTAHDQIDIAFGNNKDITVICAGTLQERWPPGQVLRWFENPMLPLWRTAVPGFRDEELPHLEAVAHVFPDPDWVLAGCP